MKFSLNEEQRALRGVVREYLGNRAPVDETRRWIGRSPGYDREVWRELATGLGVVGLGVPAQSGGAGAGMVELAVAFEEAGRVLYSGPLLATTGLAVEVLKACGGSEQGEKLLSAICSGDLVATVAMGGADAPLTLRPTEASCERGDRDGWSVTGRKSYVLHGDSADRILVVADAPRSGAEVLAVLAVDPTYEGVGCHDLEPLDVTRPACRIELADVSGELIATGAADRLRRSLAHARLLLGAEMLGGGQRCLEIALEHARSRVQFGEPIGAFQAVQHKCANMHIELEKARTAVYYAACRADEGSGELVGAAALAAQVAAEAYVQVARDTIQIHGGMGFTWEHDAHLYYRRAVASRLLLGDSADLWSEVYDGLAMPEDEPVGGGS